MCWPPPYPHPHPRTYCPLLPCPVTTFQISRLKCLLSPVPTTFRHLTSSTTSLRHQWYPMSYPVLHHLYMGSPQPPSSLQWWWCDSHHMWFLHSLSSKWKHYIRFYLVRPFFYLFYMFCWHIATNFLKGYSYACSCSCALSQTHTFIYSSIFS